MSFTKNIKELSSFKEGCQFLHKAAIFIIKIILRASVANPKGGVWGGGSICHCTFTRVVPEVETLYPSKYGV